MNTRPRVPKTCECGNEKTHCRAVACPSCLEIERGNRDPLARHIVSWLQREREWVPAVDIRVGLDLGEHDGAAVSTALESLARRGIVEKTGGCAYRVKRRAA